MKSKAALFWCLVSMALALALVLQWNAGRKQREILEKVQLQVEKLVQAEKQAEARVEELKKDRLQLSGDLHAAEFELNQARALNAALQNTNAAAAARQPASGATAAAAPGQRGGAGMGEMLATMMKDPEMRKAMEHQQRMGLEMIYGSLFKQLQLTPEQEKKFRELLLEQQMSAVSQAGELFGNATNRAQVAQQLAEQNKQRQEQLKEVLGEEKYQQMQEYNQTIGERMMLEQFGRQVEISPEQQEQLLGIVREERKNIQINRNLPPADPNQDWQKLMQPGAAAEQMFAVQEEVYGRVLDRAGTVLTPEQLQKFAPLLQNQLEMQKAGLKMARQMMGGENNASPGPPPVPVQQ